MGQGASAEAAPCQAAVRGDVAAVEQWLKAGGDPNAVHKSLKGTALQAAARGDHVECLELLLRNGADVNRATEEGTALHAAASRCCHRAVHLLLRWGANPAATNAAGMTAAEVAANLGYANLAREIVQKARHSRSARREGSLDVAAVAQPVAAGAAASLPSQQPTSPAVAGPTQLPSPQPSFSRPSQESPAGHPATPPVQVAAAAATAAPQPRPYAQQWPAVQPQPAPLPQARPPQWPGAQQPQQAVAPGASQFVPSQQQLGTQQQQQQQQQPGWPSIGQAGPVAQPRPQLAAAGWGAALARAPPAQGRPLKWWQQPQNQPPPPVAHSHPAYQAWLQQQAAWQQQQQAQQVHAPQGYGSHALYPAGYGSGYTVQPAAPAGYAYQLNPATGSWALVPAAQSQPAAAATAPLYPSLRPGSPPPSQSMPTHQQQAAMAAPQRPPVLSQAASLGGSNLPQQTPWAASLRPAATAPAAAAAAGGSNQLAPSSPAGGSAAAASSAAAAKPQTSPQAAPAASAAADTTAPAAVASAASAPAELLLAEAAGEDHLEDISSAGSLLPSPSAPPATNSLLDRLYGQGGWQQLQEGVDGGKGAAAAAVQPEQSVEAVSPKGTVEAMVALGLADSGVTDDQEQLQVGAASRPGSAGALSGGSSSSGGGAMSALAAAGSALSGQLLSQDSSDSMGRPLGVLRSNASCMVDISPWEVKWEDLHKQGSIGEGAFGAVYKAMWHETQVAVKVVGELQRAQEAAGSEAQQLSSPILQNLRLECGLMASMRHPNVVQFLGVCARPPAIVTEYCGRGSLTQVLQEGLKSPQRAAQLTWLRRLRMALDAAKGMLYLHKRGIVHRDLKSPNLLVDSSWTVKVADFNLSKVTEGAALNPSSTMGNVNPRWLAPEILEEHPATCQSDVYAYGVTMWELMTWRLPWGNAQIWTIMGQVMCGNRPSVPEPSAYGELPGPGPFPGLPAWVELMQRCWHQDPEQRPDFSAIIAQLRDIQALAAGGQNGSTVQRQLSAA